jgi:hypothetical protein
VPRCAGKTSAFTATRGRVDTAAQEIQPTWTALRARAQFKSNSLMKGKVSALLSHTFREGRVLFGPEFFLVVVIGVYVAALVLGVDERHFPLVLVMICPFAFSGTLINAFRLGRLTFLRRIAFWVLVIVDAYYIFVFTLIFGHFWW